MKQHVARMVEEPADGSAVTVPVWLDAKRTVENVDMLRATYFVVSTSAQHPQSGTSVLEFILGETVVAAPGGIVIRPADGSGRFDTVSSVEALFDLDDDDSELSVDIDDVWLPRAWLPEQADRGEVFRVGWSLFVKALAYTDGDLNLRGLMSADFVGQVTYSGVETEVVRGWAQSEIVRAKESFDDKAVKLRWVSDEEWTRG